MFRRPATGADPSQNSTRTLAGTFRSAKRLSGPKTMEALMAELYLQRAAECERMALERPAESETLKDTAETWRLLAEISDEATVH